jgi:hypothetical protein
MSVLRSLAFGLSVMLGTAALAGVPSALASEGGTAKIDPVTPEQEFYPCEGGTSRVKVKLAPDVNGRLEAVGVVFSEGEHAWSWKFKHNDEFSAKGEVRAKEREVDRSFRVVRTMVNLVGPDTVEFRAINSVTNELCSGDVVLIADSSRNRPRPGQLS